MFGPALYNVGLLCVIAFLVTTTGLLVLGPTDHRSPFAPVNSISHMLYGQRAYVIDEPKPKYLLPGILLNFGAMLGWAAVAEIVLRLLKVQIPQTALNLFVCSGVTLLAYFVDFYVVPKRFTPGFEHVLSSRSMLVLYALMAASLFAGSMFRV